MKTNLMRNALLGTCLVAILAGTSVSCSKADISTAETGKSASSQIELKLAVKCPAFSTQTKSSYIPRYTEEYVSDLNVFVYRNGKLVPGSTYYSNEVGYVILRFPDETSDYDVFCLANLGRQYAPENESVLKSSSYDLPSMDSFPDLGLPMAASYLGVKPSDLYEINLIHLVGAFDISFNNKSTVTEYCIKSLCLKNSARDLHPFSPKAAEAANATGDYLSASDIATLNRGESVRMYFTENLQGSLLPDNTDPLNRIPTNLGDRAALCSYVEIVADASTPTADYTDNVYRAYLGSNLDDDFSIVRNVLYTVNLDYEADMIKEKDWILTPGPYIVTGQINTSADEIPLFASLASDALSCIDIDVPDGVEYTVSVPSAKGKIKVLSDALSRTDETTGKTLYREDGHFVFRSTFGMSNTACGAQAQCETVPVVIETADGILTKTFNLKHYRSGFPVKFKYENGSLWVRATNPLSQRIKLSFSFNVCKSTTSWSATDYDFATLVPGSGWTQISSMPGDLLSAGAGMLPDKCFLTMSLSFPDCAGVDILNPSASTLPFYIANMPDMIPSKGPSIVRKIGLLSVNRGFDGSILSYPPNSFGPSDKLWHDSYVAAELSNVSDAGSFMVADKTIISKWNTTTNPSYLHSTDKYVVISSSGMDLGLCYQYGGWYDFRNVMRLSADDAASYPVLAHFGHSLPYEQYEEYNRSITFSVNSQSWWYSFGVDRVWFDEE